MLHGRLIAAHFDGVSIPAHHEEDPVSDSGRYVTVSQKPLAHTDSARAEQNAATDKQDRYTFPHRLLQSPMVDLRRFVAHRCIHPIEATLKHIIDPIPIYFVRAYLQSLYKQSSSP
jgi:hypothetical protein